MSDNLAKFVSLEKLFSAIKHGRVELEVQLRNGEVASVTAKGNKKLLFNSSEKDINNNQVALEYIVKRVGQQLEKKISSELIFKVRNVGDQIKSVELESTQTIK